jgi:FMN phosphatase YigB (HAD superfamily)
MIDFEPKYITFDMHGTLIRWHMAEMTRELLADIVPADQMDEVIHRFKWQRLDEVLEPWKPCPRHHPRLAPQDPGELRPALPQGGQPGPRGRGAHLGPLPRGA